MAITTTRDGRIIAPPFSWSFSKLEAYETCPRRYYETQVLKSWAEEKGEAALYGDAFHKVAADRLLKKVYKPGAEGYGQIIEPWAAKIERIGGPLFVEQKWALADDFAKTGWFEKYQRPAWFRGIGDVVALSRNEQVALAIDWKTGNIKENSAQLALMAVLVFAHYPTVQAIRSEFIWLKHDASTREDFKRTDVPAVWASILPRVQKLRDAHGATDFPEKPGGLCKKYCPVRSCKSNGNYTGPK
jgi:hypothetical protein